MRLIFTLTISVLSFVLSFAQSIWSGSEQISWNTGTYLTIGSEKFSKAEVADQLQFTFTITGAASSWPQIALMNSNWKTLPGCGNAQLSNGTTNYSITNYSYIITNDMLSDLQSGGVIITGAGYTLTDVSLVKGQGSAGYENAVWIGNTDATQGWVAQSIPASSFNKAKVGDNLRLYFTDLAAGAMHTIVDGDWKAIDGYAFYNMGGLYYEYTIDQILLSKMQDKGIIINGTGYCLTHVDVINPADKTTLTASVPVTDGWIFEDKDPSITVNVTNPYDHDVEADISLLVKTDKQENYTTVNSKETVSAGTSKGITLSFKAEPGFYSISPSLNGDAVYTAGKVGYGNSDDKTVTSFIIGVDPTRIVSAPDMQPDFNDFWSETKTQLRAVDPEYTLTEIPAKSTSKRKVYLLEFKSLPDAEGNTAYARAYYAEPVATGKYPTIIHYQGYDGGTGDPWCMGGNDNPAYCELILSTRGQVINNRAPYTNTYGDWFQYGFGNKNTYYYRGAFMDAVRAVDFLCERDKVDQSRLYAEGASQGGALTYAAAALTDHPFAAIAPAIPFLGDYPDYFYVASWPGNTAFAQQKKLGLSDEEMYTFLSYFDTKNLATLIHCPVIETIGLQDNVCPPHTNMAPYNNLPIDVEKEIIYNPLLQHSTANSWWQTYNAFFNRYTTGIKTTTVSPESTDVIYDIQGRQLKETPKTGLYIKNNRTYVK